MTWAVAAMLCWSWGAFGGSQCAREVGGFAANRWRLFGALPILLAISFLVGAGPGIGHWYWFLLGGICHLGWGDVALYTAYHRIGPRLALLITLCGIPFVAGTVEWLLLGHLPAAGQVPWAAMALVGVAVALAPRERLRLGPGKLRAGIGFALVACVGQSLGVVATKIGFEAHRSAGTYEGLVFWDTVLLRLLGGTAVLALFSCWPFRSAPWLPPPGRARALAPWWLLSVVAGPVVGIWAYHIAIDAERTAIVQAVIAVLPIAVIPQAWYFAGDRPSPRSLVGAAIAVAGVIGLILAAPGN